MCYYDLNNCFTKSHGTDIEASCQMEKIRGFLVAKKLTIENDVYEREAWKTGEYLCGVDEAGRGCLAGPVVAGAAILHPGKVHELLKDSKELSLEEREAVFPWIINNSWYGIGIIGSDIVDRINIFNATKKAMKRAILQANSQIESMPGKIVIDAVSLKFDGKLGKELKVEAFPFGESRSISIAAASIVAKVTRDRIMQGMNHQIPGFGLESHKGYGTQEHREMVIKTGSSIVHRTSYLTNVSNERVGYLYEKQRSLFS